MTSTKSTQTPPAATQAESAESARAFFDESPLPLPKTTKGLVASVMNAIDDHARPYMPEGSYLQLANMLQSFHDATKSRKTYNKKFMLEFVKAHRNIDGYPVRPGALGGGIWNCKG